MAKTIKATQSWMELVTKDKDYAVKRPARLFREENRQDRSEAEVKEMTQMIMKIKIRQIEGPARKRIACEVADILQADAVLRKIAKTVPDGCYKTEVTVEYEDGCMTRGTICIRLNDINGGVRGLIG